MEKEKITGPELPDETEYPTALTEAYELMERMSASPGTETLLARRRDTGEKVTVKCFLAENPLFDHSEPETLRNLNVPPLPGFVGEYRNESMRCVLRQYVEGESLADRAAGERLTEARVREIGIQLCEELRALHSTEPPVIHRDVKPQNIILREDGIPVLIDFGIARVCSEKKTDTLILGTHGFAPPEQYGFSRTDARSDLYSLGMVLHWLLHGDTEQPQGAVTPLEKVILRMTAFDPQRRFASAAQAKKALERTEPAQRRRRLFRWAAAAALVTAVIVLGVTWFLRKQEERAAFAEPLMAEAARLNLGLAEGEALSRSRLAEVRGIYIMANQAYADADAFYQAVNRWYSEGKPDRGAMTDLADLSMMPHVEQVCVAAQQLADLSALEGLEQLKRVELKHNQIQDASVLAGRTLLTSVGLNDNPIRDLSPLLSCPNLAFLDLCDVRNYDPELIRQLGNFQYLDISNPTESYHYLGRKSVAMLRLAWTGLNTLEDLAGVTLLEDLDISHTAVSDLTPIACHTGLKVLKMVDIPVTDLTPLLSLPMLESVTLGRDQADLAESLGDAPFSILYE
ncbi:MAG: protein kinase [Clostridia bacterium]|nr:protein kinase [Clostridia bacterium]